MAEKPPPLLAFGLLTDVQYADVDDGWDFHRTSERFYRSALERLQRAISEWVDQPAATPRLRFAVNLGDLIDGKNKPIQNSRVALDRALAAWKPFEAAVGPVHHLVGNHELYNISPQTFAQELLWRGALEDTSSSTAASSSPVCYYSFAHDDAPGFRFVVLNSYGLSALGRTPDDPVAQEALALLHATNPNKNHNSPEGLEGADMRFVAFNGGVDNQQLQWLQRTLAVAEQAQEHVIVFTHIPIHPETCAPSSMLWNYPEVLAVLTQHDCVRVVFSGHQHANGYAQQSGVHFVVCDAILECAPHENAHAIVHLHRDRVVVHGSGKIPTYELQFAE